tara:strand:+ start:654 stop:854 length:201 start_codon:yes stop_codon:yes gene_type:complete
MKSSLLINRNKKNQYNKKVKGGFNKSVKKKDIKQSKQTNPSIWKGFRKCFNLRADGTCENPNKKIV